PFQPTHRPANARASLSQPFHPTHNAQASQRTSQPWPTKAVARAKIRLGAKTTPLNTMDPFTPLQPYNLLIYKDCRYGVVVREVENHLRIRHKQIPAPKRKQIIQATLHRGTWLQSQKDLKGFLLPTEPT